MLHGVSAESVSVKLPASGRVHNGGEPAIQETTLQQLSSESHPQMTDAQLKNQVVEVTELMNKFISPMRTSLKFEFHEKLHEYYVSVVDDKTGSVIREIPPKKMLDMYAAMVENMALFVDRRI